jgi:hypothetical protein
VRRLALDSGDISIASLGKTAPGTEQAMILAGKFREELVLVARGLIGRSGGTVVVDVDEKRTHG